MGGVLLLLYFLLGLAIVNWEKGHDPGNAPSTHQARQAPANQ